MLDQQTQSREERPEPVRATGWTVGRRLAVGFGSIGLLLLVTVVIIFLLLHSTIGAFNRVAGGILPEHKALSDVNTLSLNLLSETREYLLTGEDFTLADIEATNTALNQAVADYASIGLESEGSLEEEDVAEQMQQAIMELQALSATAVDLRDAGASAEEITEVADDLEEAEGALRAAIEEAEATLDAETARYVTSARMILDLWAPLVTGSLAFLLLIGLVTVVILLRRSIVGPIQILTEVAQHMAAGDLTLEAPITTDDEIGTLARTFNDMATHLRRLIADMRKRTQDLERRARYLEATSTIARDMTLELDLQRMLPQAVNLIAERLGFYHVAIFLIDATGENLVLQATSSQSSHETLTKGYRLRIGQGIVGTAVAYNQTRVIPDVQTERAYIHHPDLPDTRSEAALLLRAGGEIIGVLDVQSAEIDAFHEEDIAVLRTLADQLAAALSNARLFQQVQNSLEAERRAYGEFSRQAWQALLRSRGDLGFVRDHRGLAPISQTRVPPESDGPEEGRLLTVPLQVRDQVIGSVDITRAENAGEWSPAERALVANLGEQLSVALESARLYHDTQKRAAQDRLVGEVSARIREALNMDFVLQTAIRGIGEALGIPRVEVRMATSAIRLDGQDTAQGNAGPTGNRAAQENRDVEPD